MTHPILVTGAAGRVGGVGGLVVEALQRRGLPEFLVVIETVAAKA
jgi:tRNA A37 threonylcarbamoyladenosine dehydratase